MFPEQLVAFAMWMLLLGQQWMAIPDLPMEFVYDIHRPPITMPRSMATTAYNVIQCESGWDQGAIGAVGERGLLQIHPIHQQRMARLGLDFTDEDDRMEFAVVKYNESGWEPWSCKTAIK